MSRTFVGYSKDILIFDFESTGFLRDTDSGDVINPGDPTQLGAILLDKSSLEEKDSFLSDIQADPQLLDDWVLKNTDITPERVQAAPTRKVVAKKFTMQFSDEYFLASWNVSFDRYWLNTLVTAIGRQDTMFDYHHLDVWSLAYTYLCQHGQSSIIQSEASFRLFGQTARSAHNALDDCRRTAEVLRSVTFDKGITL